MSRFGDLVRGKKALVAPTPTPETIVEEVIEDEVYESDVSLHDMTKKELEDYGHTVGIELDKRHSKKRMVKELEEYIDNQ